MDLANSLDKEKGLNKMKSSFVSIASHEFRTPLSTILSSTTLAGKHLNKGNQENTKQNLERITSSVKNMTPILDNFLSMDILEKERIECQFNYFNIEELILETVDELNNNSKVGQYFNYDHSGDQMVLLNKKILKNILLNLLSNAIKYSDDEILIQTAVNEDGSVLQIKDQGIGIPEEEQDKLFSKFFRAKNATNKQGTGLGLNIVKLYVELLEGKINFSSTESVGTTFVLNFPNKKYEK